MSAASILLAFTLAVPTSADENVAVQIKEKLLRFEAGRWGGMRVSRDGRPLDLGFYGGKAEPYFADVPESLESLRTHRAHGITGFVLTTVGLAVVLADVAFVLYAGATQDEALLRNNLGVYYGLLGGGGLAAIIGGFFLQSSFSALFEAVNKYNAGLLNRYLPPGQRIDLDLVVGAERQGITIAYRF